MEDTTSDHGADTPPGVPRWLKLSLLVLAVVVPVLLAVMVLAGGEHGPGRHALGAAPASTAELG